MIMTDKLTLEERISDAFGKAIVSVVEAVGGAAGAVVGANQQTAGAQGTTGGQSSEGGVSAQQGSSQQHTGASHKNDVSAPELIESYNISGLQDLAHIGKSNAKLYDITATALGLGALGSGANMFQQQINMTGHADEEFSTRKRTNSIALVTVADATKEGTDNTNK
jgi:hypothetical protein